MPPHVTLVTLAPLQEEEERVERVPEQPHPSDVEEEEEEPPGAGPSRLDVDNLIDSAAQEAAIDGWDRDEEEDEEEEEAVGDWSPVGLPPEQVAGQDVVPEEEDRQLLQLLREQVWAHTMAMGLRDGRGRVDEFTG